MIHKIITITFTVFIMVGLYISCTGNPAKKTDKSGNMITADSFVNRLSELGYFKYADPKDIDSLKINLRDSFDPSNELVSLWDDKTGIPKDYRYYNCDGETLFELGGFDLYLKEFRPTFGKMGLKIDVSNYCETGDSNSGLDYRLTINGKEYVIFEKFKGYGWGEAAVKLAEIINDQLTIQGKDERVYLVNGGNDGRIIFLTSEQFAFIDKIYKNNQWKPLTPERWCKVMNVDMREK